MGTKESPHSPNCRVQFEIGSRITQEKSRQTQKVKLRRLSQSHVHQNEKSSKTNRHRNCFIKLRMIKGTTKQWATLRSWRSRSTVWDSKRSCTRTTWNPLSQTSKRPTNKSPILWKTLRPHRTTPKWAKISCWVWKWKTKKTRPTTTRDSTNSTSSSRTPNSTGPAESRLEKFRPFRMTQPQSLRTDWPSSSLTTRKKSSWLTTIKETWKLSIKLSIPSRKPLAWLTLRKFKTLSSKANNKTTTSWHMLMFWTRKSMPSLITTKL